MVKRLACVTFFFAATVVRAAAPPAPPPVAEYGRLPAIELVDISPSGDRTAAVIVSGERRDLLIFDVRGKKIVTRVPVGSTKVRDVMFAGEDLVVVTVSGTYNLGPQYPTRYELSQAAVLDLKTGAVRWVFDRGSMMNAVFGFYGLFQEDGRWVAYWRGYETGPYGPLRPAPDLYRVDLGTGRHRQVVPGDERNPDWVLTPGGQALVSSEYDEEKRTWKLFRGRDRRQVIAQGTLDVGSDMLVGLGRTPDTFVWWRPLDDGSFELVETAVAGDKPETVFEEPGKRVQGVLRDRKTGLMAGLSFAGPEPDLRWFDPKKRARHAGTVKAFEANQIVTLAAADEAFEDLVVHVDGEGDSGSYWAVDLKTGNAEPLGDVYPAVRPEHVGPSRLVQYKAADGLELEGVLTLPPGRETKNLPVVVLPHGGPELYDSLGFDWWAQAYASRGYAVWQPNFRGSAGYGAALVQAGWGEWGRKMQTDVSDGLAELARQGLVDPKRACVVGASYGGYVALAGVTMQTGLYRCAVSVAGVSDLRAMLASEKNIHGRESDTLRYWSTFMGAKTPYDPALKAISPSELADRADAPVLLIHGKDDTVVPLDQSRIMERALKRAGRPVEFVELKGEDHWLSKAETRQAMLQAAVAFVQKHNPAD